jgi:hypothetical protein
MVSCCLAFTEISVLGVFGGKNGPPAAILGIDVADFSGRTQGEHQDRAWLMAPWVWARVECSTGKGQQRSG